jgi:transposase-like protein
VVSHALVVATGVSIEGTREVLGTAVGDSESFDYWREPEFLTELLVSGCVDKRKCLSCKA